MSERDKTKGVSEAGLTKLAIGAFGAPKGLDADSDDEAVEKPKAEAKPPAKKPRKKPAKTNPTLAVDDAGAEPTPTDMATPYAARSSQVPARPEPDSRLGHRERLRHRLREAGPGAVAEYELLELVLFRAIPRQDTKPLAKRLLKNFGSLADVFNAPDKLLREVPGVGEAVINEFRLMAAIGDAVLRGRILDRPVLSSWEAVLDYVRAHIGFREVEHFHVLFLDKRNRLLRDEIQQSGTVDHTPVYPREIARRALELNATAIIMVHNHPSGDPTPSKADVTMTKTVIEAAAPLGVVVHDHIVVGREGHRSLKAMGLI